MGNIGKPLSLIGRSLSNYWDEAFNLMICNLLWFVAQLLVIPGPPATAALFYITNRVAHGHFSRIREFLRAIRLFFLDGWKWGALNLLAIVIFGNAAFFYGRGGLPEPFGSTLMLINLQFLLLWLWTQVFAFPFWLEQSEKRIGLALRNAVVFQATNLGVTLLAAFLAVIVLVITYFLPVLIGLASIALLTQVGNTIVVAQVKALRGEEE